MNLEKIISIALLTPMGDPSDLECIWGLPLLLWGSPGIGKTARVRAASRAIGLRCESTIPATRQPEDFSGVPVPDGKGNIYIACVLGAANILIKEGRGVLFLDEASQARPAVQAAMMSMVHDRVIGDTRLPPKVRIMLAANPPAEAAGGWDLEPPMANRMAHIRVPPPSVQEWTAYLIGGGKRQVENIEEGEKRVTEAWPEVYPRVAGMMAGFMNAKSSELYCMPEEGNEERGRAWASHRTWEMATRVAATCLALQSKKDDTTIQDMVEACVGRGPAVAWASWVSKADLPDPADMLARGWTPDKQRLDRTIAAFTSMASYVLSTQGDDERKKLGNRGWELLMELCECGLPDLAIPSAQSFVQGNLGTAVCSSARALMVKFGKSKIGKYIAEEG